MSYDDLYGGAYLPDDLPPLNPVEAERMKAELLLADFENSLNQNPGQDINEENVLEAAKLLLVHLQEDGYSLRYNYGQVIGFDTNTCYGQMGVERRQGDRVLIARPSITQGERVVTRATTWGLENKDQNSDTYQRLLILQRALEKAQKPDRLSIGMILSGLLRRSGEILDSLKR